MKRWWNDFILPASLVSGTIIGAGIFSLPFVFARVGIITSILYVCVFCALFVVFHLMYGDIVLDHHQLHRFPGFARTYFGEAGYIASLFLVTLQTFFALTIYIILAPSFLAFVAPALSLVQQVVIFWFCGSFVIFLSNKRIAFAEFIATAGIALVILLVGGYGIAPLFQKNLALWGTQAIFLLLPFGALLYAFNGTTAIPTVVHYFRERHQHGTSARASIIWGTIAPGLVFLVFVAGVLGLSGKITPDAVTGLVGTIPSWLLFGMGVLGFSSLWSSYFSIGRDLYESLVFDIKIGTMVSVFLVVCVPLLLFFVGFQNFIVLIEVVGGIFIGIEGIMIIAMWQKAKKHLLNQKKFLPSLPRAVSWGMYAIFSVSICYVALTYIF